MQLKNITIKINGVSLNISNQDKILWPEDGISKGDLISYYREIAKYILPHLKGRPQSQHRFPDGIHGQSFFKKNMEDAPEWAETIKIESEAERGFVNYLVCNNEATLVYLANLACIELNPWSSRTSSIYKPDWVALDIDPGENNTFEEVIETALVARDILEMVKIKSYPKTSGASGMHIYVPMGAKYGYEEGKKLAQIIVEKIHSQLPDTTSTIRNLEERGDKIYLDYLQNARGQTLASVYSVRPKQGAPVSTALEWQEVKKGLHPLDFTIHNIPGRLKKKGDIFKPVLGKGIDLYKSFEQLSA